MPTIDDLADKIISFLKQYGFKIQRYDAYTTDSIYLKLDYGVCNTIRISDHKGKKYLDYKYNLLKTHHGINYNQSCRGYARYYYGFDAVDQLLQDILADKARKLKRYGAKNYRHYMDVAYQDNRNNAGFWRQCKEV